MNIKVERRTPDHGAFTLNLQTDLTAHSVVTGTAGRSERIREVLADALTRIDSICKEQTAHEEDKARYLVPDIGVAYAEPDRLTHDNSLGGGTDD